MQLPIISSNQSTQPLQPRQLCRPTRNIGIFILTLIATFLTVCAHAQLRVEQVQRDFQVRYHLLNANSYLQWPHCSKGLTAAPQYPKDGFYGDLILDPDKGVEVVQDLVQKFYVDHIIYTSFVKAPNGYSDLDGASSIVDYGAGDMHIVSSNNVTTNNYISVLANIAADMSGLTLIAAQASQVSSASDIKLAESLGGSHLDAFEHLDHVDSCDTVLSCASAAYSSLSWGHSYPYGGVAFDGSCFTSIDQDPSSFSGAIRCSFETVAALYDTGSPVITHYRYAFLSQRGKISADLSGFSHGQVKVFLKLSALTNEYPEVILLGDESPVTFTSNFAQTRPNNADPNVYRIWQNGTLTLGGVSTTDYVDDSQAAPQALGSCSLGTYRVYGWKVVDQLAIVQPDFTIIPDPQDCCSCTKCVDPSTYLKSIHANIPLGGDNFDSSAGVLTLDADVPNVTLATPSALRYSPASTVEVITDSSSPVQHLQFKSSQLLANVLTNNPYNYVVSFYTSADAGIKDGSGFYVPTGSAYMTVTVENPDASPSTYNRLRLTTVSDSHTTVTDYIYNSGTGQWEMDTGGGLRKETRTSTWSGVFRTETVTVSNAANQVVFKEVNAWQLFPWGQEIITNVVDPDGAALTSTRSFYTNSLTDGGGYRQLKQSIDANGHWVRFQYDQYGRETNRVSQFLNSAVGSADNLNRVTTTSYSTNAPQITTIDSLLGTEIGRDYKVVGLGEVDDYRCQTRGAAWTAADNLLTITKTLTNGLFRGQLQSMQNPDGTVQIYSYATNSSQKTTVVLSGVPDPGNATNILEGTESITVTALGGQVLTNTVKYKAQGGAETITDQDIYTYLDARMRSYQVVHLDGTTNQYDYACCGLDFEIDRDGTLTQYSYDGLKRQIASLRNGITTSNLLDANGALLATVRVGTNGSQIIQQQMAYDVAGRVLSETNALQGVTTHTNYFDGSGQLIRLTLNPDLSTRIETYAQDGSLVSLSGTAAHPVNYLYGVDTAGAYTVEVRLDANGGTNEWTKTYTDMAGRAYKTVYAGASGNPYAISYYNNQAQLINQTDPDGVATMYAYNSKGEQVYTALDTNLNQVIDLATDRVTFTTNDVVSDNGCNVRRSRTYAFPTPGSTNSVLLATTETSVDGLRSWNILYNNGIGLTNFSQTVYAGSGVHSTTNIAPDGSYMISVYQNGLVTSSTDRDANGNQIAATTYSYDPHGRQNVVTDTRTGAITSYFNYADQITNMVMPTVNDIAESTTYYFDNQSRLIATLLPDNTWTSNKYTPRGELQQTYGSRTYAVGYGYDAQGRMTSMTNWTTASTGTGARVTTWKYDAYRGFMTNKVYDSNTAGPSYSYTETGRPASRTWARGITTTYTYDTIGELSSVTYSDGTTPSVSYAYDRRGRQSSITTGGTITCTLAYNDAGNLLSESYLGGPLNGVSITNSYDTLLRRTNLSTLNGSTVLYATAYGYDAASRLFTASDGTNSAAYSYLANSPLVSQIAFTNNGALRMTTTKTYDNLNRLTAISSANGSSMVLDSHSYAYNAANQRTAVTNTDSSRWAYGYDALGQVTSGKKYWGNGIPVAGEQFTYTFDDIGNRTATQAGGDQFGLNLRSAAYSANNLNQYTSRTAPGAVNILGEALSNATVTVNYQPAYRRGSYYRDELSINNSSSPAWQAVTNLAVLNQNTSADIISTNIGNIYLPQTPEQFSYDVDGNLTSDGRWTNTWDAENRLISMQSLTNGPAGSKLWLNFSYDYQGRRVTKLVQSFNGSMWAVTDSNKFAYDGWNLIADLNGTNNAVIQVYMWGSDLSGTLQGAGGVGGLLAISDPIPAQFTSFDGNGNITALIDTISGVASERYEYGPSGEILSAFGQNINNNPFCWSTRYRDVETELVFYPARPYNPSVGCWWSRDPLEEEGGANISGFQQNDSIQNVDPLGFQFMPSIQFGFRSLPSSKNASQEAETTFVAKSFINGLPRLGSLIGRKPIFSTAIALASPLQMNGVTYSGEYANIRLGALSQLTLNTFNLNAFHEDPANDSKDGQYRLYTRVKIEAACCNGKPLIKALTDDDGGHELGPLWGTINISSDVTDTASGDKAVHWRGWGRPNRFLEPGMQLVAARDSVNIWHDVTVIVSCSGGKPLFVLDKVITSRFPSFRLWQDGTLIENRPQGSFSDLWQGIPDSLSFVAP